MAANAPKIPKESHLATDPKLATAKAPAAKTIGQLRKIAAGWKPRGLEIQACRPWIEAEIRIVPPQVLVCLGATAAQALLGKTFRVNTQRGQLVESELAEYATATVHPSSILRAPDDAARQAQMAAFVKNLKQIAKLVRSA